MGSWYKKILVLNMVVFKMLNTLLKNVKIKNNRGITLIETMVYISLFSILILVLVDIFSLVINEQNYVYSNSQVTQDYNYIFAKLKSDINNSNQIVFPLSVNTLETELIIINDNNTYTYKLQENSLFLYINDVPYKLNNDSTMIKDLTFRRISYQDNPGIKIEFKIGSVTDRLENYKNFSTTLGIR